VTLETRIETQTLAAASLLREPVIAESLVLVAVAAGRESPGPELRPQYARLIEALASRGATAIVVDLRFQQPSATDAELAAAIRAARVSQTAVHLAFNELRSGHPHVVPALIAAASSAGFACVGKRLGVANSVPIAARDGQDLWPALALLAAAPGASIVDLDPEAPHVAVQAQGGRSRTLSLSYVETSRVPQTGCPLVGKGTVRGYALVEVPAADALRHAGRRFTLDAVLREDLPGETFRNKTVVVGVETDRDSFRVARGLGTEMRYGYELHALAASALATGTVPRKLDPDSQGWIFLLAGGLGALLGYVTSRAGRLLTAGGLASVVAAYFAATVVVFARTGILLNTGYELVSLLCMFGLLRALVRRWLPWDSRPRPLTRT
jgi:CHASE2 domain-containing sensor protein